MIIEDEKSILANRTPFGIGDDFVDMLKNLNLDILFPYYDNERSRIQNDLRRSLIATRDRMVRSAMAAYAYSAISLGFDSSLAIGSGEFTAKWGLASIDNIQKNSTNGDARREYLRGYVEDLNRLRALAETEIMLKTSSEGVFEELRSRLDRLQDDLNHLR